MKKSFIILLTMAFFTTAQPARAQENIAKLSPAGFFVQTPAGAAYQFTGAFEHVFTDNISLQGDIGFISGFGTMGIIKPQFHYYITGEAPVGLYVGAYTAFAFRSGGAIIGLGPKAGYQHLFLDNQLAVYGDLGLGVGFNTFGGTVAGFNMSFSVGAGYAF